MQACSSEVMMLRTARRYDAQSDSIVYANNQPHGRDSYTLAGMTGIIESLLRFCRAMYVLKVDNAEYALLTAIVIFSGKLRSKFKNNGIRYSQNENFFVLHEQILNFLKDHDLLVTNSPKKNFPPM